MNRIVRRKVESAKNIRDFGRKNPSADEGYKAAMARLDEHLETARELEEREAKARAEARKSRARRREIRQVQHELLAYLTAVGLVAAGEGADIARDLVHSPRRSLKDVDFINAARVRLTYAQAQKELLVGKGMNPGLLDEFTNLIAAFETEVEATRAARLEHKTARIDLDYLAAQLSADVRMLDGVYRYVEGKDLHLLNEWERLRETFGLSARVSDPQPPEGGPTPPAQSGPAQAA